MTTPINLESKLAIFADPWNPRLIAELNGQHIKLARLDGPFIWHHHEREDELFLVVEGEFRMEFRDGQREWSENVSTGELIVVPAGVEHRPVADQPCAVLLFEPAGTLNTGSAQPSDLTRDRLESL